MQSNGRPCRAAFAEAGELHSRFLSIRSSDTYARGRQVRAQCESILTALDSFRMVYRDCPLTTAAACVVEFIDAHGVLNRDATGTADLLSERAWTALVLLDAFETEMSFILQDRQEVNRVRSERAFAHLRRSIVADSGFNKKWRKAFKDGEVACEKPRNQ